MKSYDVTPLANAFADVLNRDTGQGYATWSVNGTHSVFGENFVCSGWPRARNFMEHDLVYLPNGMLFWGARNFDGRSYAATRRLPVKAP
ncbi:hypothetical protein JJ685_03030 [Ramlibacter monticola]|uniref:Uncharacterized protein n=1 Tax=Ramlibacter monticola TaxID=1926872 RepID=A0A936YTV3_9BURK|nr:hypothetical protein [Ramlibacter monticola]MBL0390110.1 hypothetical protein [Ramlibacter monticola]